MECVKRFALLPLGSHVYPCHRVSLTSWNPTRGNLVVSLPQMVRSACRNTQGELSNALKVEATNHAYRCGSDQRGGGIIERRGARHNCRRHLSESNMAASFAIARMRSRALPAILLSAAWSTRAETMSSLFQQATRWSQAEDSWGRHYFLRSKRTSH